MAVSIQRATERIQVSTHITNPIEVTNYSGVFQPAHWLPVCRQDHICCHFEISAIERNTGVHFVPHGCKALCIPQNVRIIRCAAAGDARLRSPFPGLYGDGDAGILRDGGGDFCVRVSQSCNTAIGRRPHFVGQGGIHIGCSILGNGCPLGGTFRLAVPLVANHISTGGIVFFDDLCCQLTRCVAHRVFTYACVGHFNDRRVVDSIRHFVDDHNAKTFGPFHTIDGIGDRAAYPQCTCFIGCIKHKGVRCGHFCSIQCPTIAGMSACFLNLLGLRFIKHHFQGGFFRCRDLIGRCYLSLIC